MGRTAKQQKSKQTPPTTSGRRFLDSEIAALVTAWDAGDDKALQRIGAGAGVKLVGKTLREIGTALEPKKTRSSFEQAVISQEALLATIGDALAHPAGLAVRSVSVYGSTVMCLVVVDKARIVVGIARTSNANDKLAKAWPQLKPWHSDLGRNRDVIETWLTDSSLDSFVRARGRFEFARVAIQAAATPDPDATETSALLAAVVADPHDEAARLVLADALQKQGDAHGELIAVELEAARVDEPHRAKLLVRAQRLYAAHGDRIAGEIAGCTTHHEFARGFVTTVTMNAGSFGANGERLFAAHPIEQLELRPLSSATLAKLAGAPALARVRELLLGHGKRSGRLPVVDLAPLAASPHLGKLTALQFIRFAGERWVDAFSTIRAPVLAELEFIGANVDPLALAAIAKNAGTPRLASLKIDWPSDDTSSRAVLRRICTALGERASLRNLEVSRLGIDAELVRCLFAGAGGQALERLDVGNGDFDDTALAAIVASGATALRELDVSLSCVTGKGILAFMTSPAGRRVEKLVARLVDLEMPDLADRLAAKLPAKHPLHELQLAGVDEYPARFSGRR